MAKEFKDFDKKYARSKRTDDMEPKQDQAKAHVTTYWAGDVLQWSQEKVQFAVYKAGDHEKWQEFRVSLKGQSTGMKLWRLTKYKMDNIHKSMAEYEIVLCRIDNYLGALVRGGQLNSKYEVVR